MSRPPLYGLLAEFDCADRLLGAVRHVRATSPHTVVEAYSPFPIEGLSEAAGSYRQRIPLLMLLGGILGGLGTFVLEWYSAALDYPINVGGRPTASWPAFLPPAIEMAVLFAALLGVIGMLAGNGLPRLHHPLFALKVFERASADRFFLLLRTDDAAHDTQQPRELLEALSPLTISEVPA